MQEDYLKRYTNGILKEVGKKVKTVDDIAEECSALCEALDIECVLSFSTSLFNPDNDGKNQYYFKVMASGDKLHQYQTIKALIEETGEQRTLHLIKLFVEERMSDATGQAEDD